MATLQQTIDQIQDAVGAISGIRLAPDEPPDSAPTWPIAIAYVQSGVFEPLAAEHMQGLHDIAVDLHVPHKDLSRDVAKLMTYVKAIPNAIYGILYDGTIMTTALTFQQISYTLTTGVIAEQPTVVLRYVVEGVKTTDAVG